MQRIIARVSASRTLSRLQQYVAATAIVAMFVTLRLALGSVLPAYPFLILFPSVIVAALLFDSGVGTYAALLSAAAAWFFIEPPFSLTRPELSGMIALALYVPVTLFTARVIEELRKALDDLQRREEDLQRAVRRLQATDTEKDVLMREVNHRIRNDLQLVSSLLHLQGRKLADPDAKAALATAAERVRVMGRVHTRLTRCDTHATVDMREFLEGLCEDLRSALIGVRPVAVQVHADEITVPLSQAVPLGLTVNELLTNALKYAFPDGRNGVIHVSMACELGACRLEVRDDGVGMQGKAPREGSLGLSLVRSLVQTIGGEIRTAEDGGVVHTIRFPHSALN